MLKSRRFIRNDDCSRNGSRSGEKGDADGNNRHTVSMRSFQSLVSRNTRACISSCIQHVDRHQENQDSTCNRKVHHIDAEKPQYCVAGDDRYSQNRKDCDRCRTCSAMPFVRSHLIGETDEHWNAHHRIDDGNHRNKNLRIIDVVHAFNVRGRLFWRGLIKSRQ